MGIVKLQISAILSSPQVELIVKNLSAHHLILDWSFISPVFMVDISSCTNHPVDLFMISDKRPICHCHEENPASAPLCASQGCTALGLLPTAQQLQCSLCSVL